MIRRVLPFVLLAVATSAVPVRAQQANFVIDRARSLAWWQLDPHFGHLWATTCPDDPSWQPGEGHSSGYRIDYKKRPKIKVTNESATAFPLFPRDTVRANCRSSVSGTFSTSDVKRYGQMRGSVSIMMDSITNGSDSRDLFARKYIYGSAKWPQVKFTMDSLTAIQMLGDTVNAVAVGTFELRGVQKPLRVQVQGVQEPSGLRVRGLFAMPAKELEERFDVSKAVLSMGVGMKLWHTLFMGFDLILVRREG